jgi:hypothetical protein
MRVPELRTPVETPARAAKAPVVRAAVLHRVEQLAKVA